MAKELTDILKAAAVVRDEISTEPEMLFYPSREQIE